MRSPAKSRRQQLQLRVRLGAALFLISWLWAALLVFPFDTDDTNSMLQAAVNLVDTGHPTVTRDWTADSSLVEGKYYSGFGPGGTALALPVYALLHPWIGADHASAMSWQHWTRGAPPGVGQLRFAMVALVVAPMFAAFALLLFRYFAEVEAVEPVAAFGYAGAGAFGTLLLQYSSDYSRHAIATLAIMIGLLLHLLSEKTDRPSPARGILCGALIWASVSVEYLCGLLAAGASLLIAWDIVRARGYRALGPFLAGAAASSVALGTYHIWYFGSPLATPYGHRTMFREAFSLTYRGAHIDSREFEHAAGLPSVRTLMELAFSPFRGIFLHCPALIVGLSGCVLTLRGQRSRLRAPRADHSASPALAAIALGVFAAVLLVNSSLKHEVIWSGFPTWYGPRFLIPGIPLLLLGIPKAMQTRARPWMAGLLGLSVAISLIASMYQDALHSVPLGSELQLNELWEFSKLFLSHGPRVPILDRLEVASSLQWTAIAGAAALSAASFFIAKRQACSTLK